MKNQYFGDVNDYRKYGLLRSLTTNGANFNVGVCWMLTPDDNSNDGGNLKLHYLRNRNVQNWELFDPRLYATIRQRIWSSENDEVIKEERRVSHFDTNFLQNSTAVNDILGDSTQDRRDYFDRAFRGFVDAKSDLVFFDPDNGFAGDVGHRGMKKGATDSCKFLFADEVARCIGLGFSALVYQHFRQRSSVEYRQVLVREVVAEMTETSSVEWVASFVTPDVFYVLVPSVRHERKLAKAVEQVHNSTWAIRPGTTRSQLTDSRQLAVQPTWI
jgi:hypothetical protein